MRINKTHEIELVGRTLEQVITDMVGHLRTASALKGLQLLLSNEEEEALDRRWGMMWPMAIATTYLNMCGQPKATFGSRCQISFPDEAHVLATFA